jgi:lysylphosphatidylglycerol synthetase-like protein (DUF2156 family)
MKLKATINVLIYLSVIFGLILLVQLYNLVPSWLFYSVLTGWVVYLIVAVFAATGRKQAYPLALILAILTLLVSLPQPEHYAYVEAGLSLATITFLAGSTLQIALIILDGIYLAKNRGRA